MKSVVMLGTMFNSKLKLIFTDIAVCEDSKIVTWNIIYDQNGNLIDSANPESLEQTIKYKGKSFVTTIRGISLSDDCYVFEDIIKYEQGE